MYYCIENEAEKSFVLILGRYAATVIVEFIA